MVKGVQCSLLSKIVKDIREYCPNELSGLKIYALHEMGKIVSDYARRPMFEYQFEIMSPML